MNLLSDPWSTHKDGDTQADSSNESRIKAVTDTLQGLKESEEAWSKLALLISDDYDDESQFRELLVQVQDLNDTAQTGVSLLVYCVVFDKPLYIEILHNTGKLDANVPDKIFGCSPLTWCIHLNRQQCCVELLNFADELDFGYENPGGFTALDLLIPGNAMYEFAKEHELFRFIKNNESAHDSLFKAPASTFATSDVDHTLDQIDLQTAGLNINQDDLFTNDENSTQNYKENSFAASFLSQNFDFENVLPNQYIEFADYDIPRLLELLVSLPSRKPHKTCIPAAIIFQCIRFADKIRQSTPLVESVAHLSLTKILSSAASSSGGVLNNQSGDIILQSYWLSSLNFLFYYLYRQDGFFKRYPSILQELIDGMRSLILELNTSIHSRIEPLIEPTLLEHTTIAQVKETLYKKDWNLFKKRKHRSTKSSSRDSYDETLAMLYPPSLDEQMKPSPLKIVQIFGALSYVLDLHQVHPLIAQQCLSVALKWFSAKLFNKMMDNKKKSLSRAHAVQIRLNLSVIQDWIKNHNFKAPLPTMIDDFMWRRFPYTLVLDLSDIDGPSKPFELRNVTFYSPADEKHAENMDNSLFYYQSFYHISQIHMEPCMQLLQWLQVATSLEDEESLNSTLSILNKLSPAQLLKSVEKYRYDSDEQKFKSPLKKKLVAMVKETSSTNTRLAEKTLCSLTLPTITELIGMYTQREDAQELLPLLPMDVQDDVDEIHEQNVKQQQLQAESAGLKNRNDSDNEGEASSSRIEGETGDELFKELNAPSTAAQRPLWAINSDIEANPW